MNEGKARAESCSILTQLLLSPLPCVPSGSAADSDTVVASISLGLFDARRRLRSGRWALRMFTPDVSALEEEGGAGGGGGGGGAGTGGPADDGEVRPKKQFVRSVPVSIAAGVWPHLGQTLSSAPRAS